MVHGMCNRRGLESKELLPALGYVFMIYVGCYVVCKRSYYLPVWRKVQGTLQKGRLAVALCIIPLSFLNLKTSCQENFLCLQWVPLTAGTEQHTGSHCSGQVNGACIIRWERWRKNPICSTLCIFPLPTTHLGDSLFPYTAQHNPWSQPRPPSCKYHQCTDVSVCSVQLHGGRFQQGLPQLQNSLPFEACQSPSLKCLKFLPN